MKTSRHILLSGESIALAKMTIDDQPSFQHWLSSNPELQQLIENSETPTMDDQLKWFKRVQEPDRKMFSLVTLPDKVLIGNAGFVKMNEAEKSAEFRITIGNTEYLNKGLGTEATTLALRYGFEELKLETVTLRVLQSNERAIRVYEKTGFMPQESQDNHDILRMSMDRHTFFSRAV